MLSNEVIEKVIERLARRIEQSNIYLLEQVGESIKKIGALTPTEAHNLVQIMRYGGDYDKIVKELSKMTKLNTKDIYDIFEEVAKSDYEFAKQFYDYRNKKFIPYEENIALKRQVEALAKITADSYVNLTQTMAFAKVVGDEVIYSPLAEVYQDILDKAVLNMAQGRTTFDKQLHKSIKELATNGINVVGYDKDGKERYLRLDSAVRMQMNDALQNLHNETQLIFGKEFDSDGVEITIEFNPAPDHEMAQGKQFSTNQYDKNGKLIKRGEYEKLQDEGIAKTYDGELIDLHKELKSGLTPSYFRPIGHYNCRHRVFAIVLGVNEPQYSKKELQEIRDKNNKGFDFEGKHYTNYEGTQLQRKIELEIRKSKDEQIISVASGDEEGIRESQERIRILTKKYKKLSNASGLPTKIKRLTVSGYKRTKV